MTRSLCAFYIRESFSDIYIVECGHCQFIRDFLKGETSSRVFLETEISALDACRRHARVEHQELARFVWGVTR